MTKQETWEERFDYAWKVKLRSGDDVKQFISQTIKKEREKVIEEIYGKIGRLGREQWYYDATKTQVLERLKELLSKL